MSRVYEPVTSSDVESLQTAGAFRPLVGVSATESLRKRWPEEDDEGVEYVATQYAAAASQAPRIVVAALEIAPEAFSESDAAAAPGFVQFNANVLARDVVCFLVADEGAQVSEEEDLELSWYDAGEVQAVASEISAS